MAYTSRRLTDARELRALAHPTRMALLEEVTVDGPLTATELAERVGESPANCSWHLRQLARYGFVEEAGGGTGRQRPWRAVTLGTSWGETEEDAETAAAADAASDVFLERQLTALRRQLATRRAEPKEWQDAIMVGQSLAWLTAAELAEIGEQVKELWMAKLARLEDRTLRPSGARLVRLLVFGFPDDRPGRR